MTFQLHIVENKGRGELPHSQWRRLDEELEFLKHSTASRFWTSEDQKIPRSIGCLSKLVSLSASKTFFYRIDLRIIQIVEDNRRDDYRSKDRTPVAEDLLPEWGVFADALGLLRLRVIELAGKSKSKPSRSVRVFTTSPLVACSKPWLSRSISSSVPKNCLAVAITTDLRRQLVTHKFPFNYDMKNSLFLVSCTVETEQKHSLVAFCYHRKCILRSLKRSLNRVNSIDFWQVNPDLESSTLHLRLFWSVSNKSYCAFKFYSWDYRNVCPNCWVLWAAMNVSVFLNVSATCAPTSFLPDIISSAAAAAPDIDWFSRRPLRINKSESLDF